MRTNVVQRGEMVSLPSSKLNQSIGALRCFSCGCTSVWQIEKHNRTLRRWRRSRSIGLIPNPRHLPYYERASVIASHLSREVVVGLIRLRLDEAQPPASLGCIS